MNKICKVSMETGDFISPILAGEMHESHPLESALNELP